VLFPIVAGTITMLIAPMGAPLMGMLMLGNLLKESGVVGRLADVSSGALMNIVTLLLGVCIGAAMLGGNFLQWQTILVFGLGLLAICLDTVTGVLLGKVACVLSRGKINPLIGAAGTSAFPMSARVVQKEGQKAILIGKGGTGLKEIGRRARLEMQKAFARKVYLGLWVKVREGWSNDVRALKSLGYHSEED
jgi:Na+-transporting methylmalonyl-CoA/oxaloacetate decarboxylase beta subunit